MCEYSRRLVAWIDGEDSGGEASEIALHLAECAECRTCAAELRTVSATFEEYCGAFLHASAPSEARWRKPALLAAAAAIVLVLVFTQWRRPVTLPMPAPSATASARTTSPPVQTSVASVSSHEKRDVPRHHRRSAPAAPTLQARARTPSWRSASDTSSLRIAIPADAIFAPGALPDGMIFVADLSIGADGRVEQLRLVPQPVPFERRLEQ